MRFFDDGMPTFDADGREIVRVQTESGFRYTYRDVVGPDDVVMEAPEIPVAETGAGWSAPVTGITSAESPKVIAAREIAANAAAAQQKIVDDNAAAQKVIDDETKAINDKAAADAIAAADVAAATEKAAIDAAADAEATKNAQATGQI